GLGAIKGTGEQAIEAIVAAREGRGSGPRGDVAGPFKSLFDFCARVDRARLNKRTVDALIKAGAFDSLGVDRATLCASIDRAFDFASAAEANALQGGLFDMGSETQAHGSSTQEPELVVRPPWGVKERLMLEKAAVGFFLSGHLFDEVTTEVRSFAKREIAELSDSREQQTVAGLVSDLRTINGQRGKLALFKLDDKSAQIEAVADEAVLNANRNTLKDDEVVIVSGRLQPGRGGFEARFQVQQVWDLATARCRFGKFLRVAVNGKAPDVAGLLRDFPPRREPSEQGELVRGLGVRLALLRDGAAAELQLDDDVRFYPSDAALARWIEEADQGRATIVYE
ncbi:MAG: OB-fold nucleic acid binding domain-containing protein, partial [Burkholderiales bacterium]